MRTRYGSSPWLANVPSARRPDHPRLRGQHAADIVVVGAGLTGCATALACAMAGRTTMLLEADRIGQGSSARSAGLLLPDPPVRFRDVTAAHGRATARKVFEAWRHASSDAAAQLTRLKIPCGLERLDVIDLASGDGEALLRRELAARVAAGMPGRWLGPKEAARASARDVLSGGLHLGRGFALDPYRACIGMAAAAARRGVLVAERTGVRGVTPGAKGAEVRTDGACIHAETVIVATGLPTEEFSPLTRHFTARETYVVLTEPMPPAMRRLAAPAGVVLLEGASPRRLVRATTDHRLLVAGADQAAPRTSHVTPVLVQRTGQLMYELLVRYPAISGLRPEYGWAAPYGTTADGIMGIGPHRNYPRHVFAFGEQESVTGAFLAAAVLTRAMCGHVDKTDAAFGWNR